MVHYAEIPCLGTGRVGLSRLSAIGGLGEGNVEARFGLREVEEVIRSGDIFTQNSLILPIEADFLCEFVFSGTTNSTR